VEALQRADVVVYDRLAAPELLKHASPKADRVCVGKRTGHQTLSQAEINALLVRLAQGGKRVVRLKGGDPFVFGRGGEEAEALAAAGIAFEVVPGITSAIAVPAYAGIPVTHRDVASSFAVVTGHEDPSKRRSCIDWDALAGVETLVILMGVSNLSRIVEELTRRGRVARTPVAMIQWGTRGTQRTVVGTLASIVERVRAARLRAPAIIVVGEVVTLREKLRWFDLKPLHGLRVLVTRTREQASRLSSALRSLGAQPVECPLIKTVPPMDWEPLDAAIRRLDVPGEDNSYHWIVFTSANGVSAFFERLSLAGLDARALAGAKIATIGPATAEVLATHGVRADLVPSTYVSEALADEIGRLDGLRVLLVRADIARAALAQRLVDAGAGVEEAVVYRTVRPEGLGSQLQATLPGLDVVAFTSSSTVRHFVGALGSQSLGDALKHTAVACIGPITAETARQMGLKPEIVAEEYTIDGLVKALVDWRMTRKNEDRYRDDWSRQYDRIP
jgi:uroporphyrinogen III methyltransferase/synthase